MKNWNQNRQILVFEKVLIKTGLYIIQIFSRGNIWVHTIDFRFSGVWLFPCWEWSLWIVGQRLTSNLDCVKRYHSWIILKYFKYAFLWFILLIYKKIYIYNYIEIFNFFYQCIFMLIFMLIYCWKFGNSRQLYKYAISSNSQIYLVYRIFVFVRQLSFQK